MNAEKRKAEADLREAEAQVSAAWKALGGAAPRERERYEKALGNADGVSYAEAAEFLAAMSLEPEKMAAYRAAFGDLTPQEGKWLHDPHNMFPLTEVTQFIKEKLEANAAEEQIEASKELDAAALALEKAAPLEWKAYTLSRGMLAAAKMRAPAPAEYDRFEEAQLARNVAWMEAEDDLSEDEAALDLSQGLEPLFKRIAPQEWAEYKAAAAAYVKAVEENGDSTTKYVEF